MNNTLDKPNATEQDSANNAAALYSAELKAASPILAGDITGATNVSPKIDKNAPKPLVDGSQKTWGEKTYNNLVYKVFGFGFNLGFSSLLTYLTKHSDWKVPVVFKKDGQNRMVKELFTDLRDWFTRSWPTKNIKGLTPALPEVRADRGEVMAGALVLTFGGHMMIPIIKLFEDNKTKIIKWLDNKHYGNNAEDIPEIKAAHDRVAEEIRPTLTSTALARVGSVVAVQLTARSIGIRKNVIKQAGTALNIPALEKYNGFEVITNEAGLDTAAALPEKTSSAINNWLLKASGQPQAKDPQNQQTGLLFKYGFTDILYTIVTALSIKPMNNWLIRNFSFLRKEPEKKPTDDRPVIRTSPVLIASNAESALQAEQTQEQQSEPAAKINTSTHKGMLTAAPELQKA